MQKQQNINSTKPVELTLEDLEHVAGGLPKGGWGQEGDLVVGGDEPAAAALADPTPLPKGGW